MRVASEAAGLRDLAELQSARQVSEREVKELLTPVETVAALERVFGPDYDSFATPTRQHIETKDGVFLVMPCYSRATGKLGVKFVAVAQASATTATVEASYVLIDPGSAQSQMFIAANWLTDLRTAAASFLATKFLAAKDARVLGIFGTGRQARAHIELFTELSSFDAVLVSGSSPERSQAFVQDLKHELKIGAEAVEADACAARADILCTCTTVRTPLFDGKLLRPGTHVNLVGGFLPDSREVDSLTIRRARVVVDTYDGAFTEAGDLLIPLRKGSITRAHIGAELHEIVTGKKPGRQRPDEITVFKSLGCALEDLAMAELIAAKLAGPAKVKSPR